MRKTTREFWLNAVYGFVLAGVVLGCAFGGAAAAITAERRTAEIGFGKQDAAGLFVADGRLVVRLFGHEIAFSLPPLPWEAQESGG